jgi:hypothetical protein
MFFEAAVAPLVIPTVSENMSKHEAAVAPKAKAMLNLFLLPPRKSTGLWLK